MGTKVVKVRQPNPLVTVSRQESRGIVDQQLLHAAVRLVSLAPLG
jgi:hypothetical protein